MKNVYLKRLELFRSAVMDIAETVYDELESSNAYCEAICRDPKSVAARLKAIIKEHA